MISIPNRFANFNPFLASLSETIVSTIVHLIRYLTVSSLLIFSELSFAQSVVGDGSPSSCTDAAINTVLTDFGGQGGLMTFNCGPQTRRIFILSQKFLTGDVRIDGGDKVILDGRSLNRIFEVNVDGPKGRTEVSLSNIELSNGLASGGFGGAVLVNAGTLTLQNVRINDSRAGLTGGAIAAAPGSFLTIRSSKFRNNTGLDGGAIATSADTRVEDSEFVLNTATAGGQSLGQGGAIQSYVSNLIIERSLFSFNLARFGGAIFKRQAALSLTNSRMENNTAATDGGAIYAEANAPLVVATDVRFIGNIATSGAGGAMYASTALIDKSLFDNNRAQNGGALSLRPLNQPQPQPELKNSTLSNNFAQVQGGAVEVQSGGNTGQFVVDQITTANNTANTGAGGDFFVAGSYQYVFVRSTLIGASAPIAIGGGSIFNSTTLAPKFGGNLIYSRQAQDCTGTIGMESLGANVGPSACNLTNAGNAAIGPDQIILALSQIGLGEFAYYGGRYNTYLPLANSLALNTFDCSSNTDARARPRPVGGRCDSGAVERQLVEIGAAIFRDGFE